MIHRDVKPANILFDEEGQPILTDFGIAKVLETDEATLTGTGLGVGTPEYMAPEQWQGKTSAATDQYALGVVLYELITGSKPYSADTPAAIAIMQATEPLSPPSGLVAGIPEPVEKVLYKALARDPQDRYENMDEFTLALRGLLADAETAEPIPTQPKDREPEPAPAGQVANVSENVTRDMLVATPVEETSAGQATASEKKRGLPKWALWTGVGIVSLVIISLAIGIGGNLVNMVNDGDGPLAMLATETFTATVTPTLSKTSIPTNTPTITTTPKPTLGVGSIVVNEKDGAEMAYIPAGEFLMGINQEEINEILESDWCSRCMADYFSNAIPQNVINIHNFWMYRHEVNNDQYRQCVDDDVCPIPLAAYYDSPTGGDFPIVNINWFEASTYCEWAGGRLPTEAEWEKAARGITGQYFPWGNTAPNRLLANYKYYYDESYWGDYNLRFSDSNIVSVFDHLSGKSPYSIVNMAGNVYEWVKDWYNPNFYEIVDKNNPQGPESGEAKILRGGSYYSIESSITSFYRGLKDPQLSSSSVGFRCVHSD